MKLAANSDPANSKNWRGFRGLGLFKAKIKVTWNPLILYLSLTYFRIPALINVWRSLVEVLLLVSVTD